MSRTLPPALLLLLYGVAFGRAALGGGLLVYDDHPGQLYRLHHAITLGLAPWHLNPGWWAGYAELQYYPPGLAWLGALLHRFSWGAVDATGAYQILLWIAWLLPGLATFALLARALGSGWLALPGAFVALTLSAGSRSGVEEGLRWGLLGARLGCGMLPLLALSLVSWVEGRRRRAVLAAPLVACVIFLHPAHAPAAFVLVVLAAWARPGDGSSRWRHAAGIAGLGLGLAALWLLPLLVHLDMALPLAWGDASLIALFRNLATHPLLLILVLGQFAVWLSARARPPRAPTTRWLLALTPAMVVLVILDALVAAPLGLLWLPADRLADGLLLALVLGGSLAAPLLPARFPRLRHIGAAAALIAVAVILSGGAPEPTLSLWPARSEWPKHQAVARDVSLDGLWQALREAPEGRALFLRSAVTLEQRPEWWRPHTHITALAPVLSGRAIINGTFTHPAPVAGLFYTGSAAPRPIMTLVEQRDGRTIFGQPLEAVTAAAFAGWCDRLAVSVVVATDEDDGRLAFLDGHPAFSGPDRIGPFRIYLSRTPRRLPSAAGPQRWTLTLPSSGTDWTPTAMAYSPNTRVESGGAPLAIRRNGIGMLEVRRTRDAAALLEITHPPATAEKLGLSISALSLALLLATWLRRASLTR